MPLGYDYGNARLRAMRSRLLGQPDYFRLLANPTREELLTALAETPYKPDIETALVTYGPTRAVNEALSQHLTRTLEQVRRFYEGEPGVLVDLLLRRWDRDNLLALVRSQLQEVPSATALTAIVPVGRLDRTALRELARQSGLRAMIDLMTGWRLPYARPLREVQRQAGGAPHLDTLELALTRFHYQTLFQELGRDNGNRAIVRQQLQLEVDLLNIRTSLRLAHIPGVATVVQRRYEATSVSPLLLDFRGCLPVERLAGLVGEGSGVEAIVRGLSETRYAPALNAGWARYQAEGGSFVMLERELERWRAGQLAAKFRAQPLSIAIPLGYIGAKEVEIGNLRLITQAIALDLEREAVQQELIIWDV